MFDKDKDIFGSSVLSSCNKEELQNYLTRNDTVDTFVFITE